MILRYAYNFLVLGSQILSVILGGHPDESISQRTARAYLWHKRYNYGSFKGIWFEYQMVAIDLLFYNKIWKIEQTHCLNSLTGESNAKEVWNWDTK